MMTRASQLPTSNLTDTKELVNSFLTSCRNRGLSPNTIRWYEGILKPFESQYPSLPDTPELLESFIASFQTGDERQHGVFRALKTFYNFSQERHDTANPMSQVKAPKVLPKEKPTLTLEQLRLLIEYPRHNPMVRALLYLLSDTGIRISEAAGLTGQDIYDSTIRVSGKTGQRIIPISPIVKELLISVLPLSTATDQRLFPHSSFWLGRLVSRAMQAVGLNGFSAHTFRHTFCTLFNGTDTALKQITGHRSWAMIEHYKHKREAQAEEQHHQHSPIALLNGGNGDKGNIISNFFTSEKITNPPDSHIDIIVKLAEELGAAKEKVRQFEQHPAAPEDKPIHNSEELEDCIVSFPGLAGAYPVAESNYLMHSMIYCFMGDIREHFKEIFKDYLMPVVLENLLGEGFSKDDSARFKHMTDFINIIGTVLSHAVEAEEKKQYSLAVTYRNLAGDSSTKPEDFEIDLDSLN